MKEIRGNRHQSMKSFISLLLLFSLVLFGCVDLKAIRKFSEISAESATFTALTEDFITSVDRQKRYEDEKYYEKLDDISKEREALRPGLTALPKIISEYMKALGELASDEIISYDKSLDDMSKELGNIKNSKGTQIFRKEDMDAFGALSKLIAKAATDMYRRCKLKEIIETSNKDFQAIITAQKRFVEYGYKESLNNEKEAVRKYYMKIIRTAESNPPQQAAIEWVHDKYIERLETINTKMKSAESYQKILNKIGEGHQLLYDNRDRMKSDQLLSTIKGYERDISNLYRTIKQLK